MDVEPIDITADLRDGWTPPRGRARPPTSRLPHHSRLRPRVPRPILRRRELVLCIAVVVTLVAGVGGVFLVPPPLTPRQLLSHAYVRLQARGTLTYSMRVTGTSMLGGNGVLTANGRLDVRKGLLGQSILSQGLTTDEVKDPTTTYLRLSPNRWSATDNGIVNEVGLVDLDIGTMVVGPQPLLDALAAVTDVRGGVGGVSHGTHCRHVLGTLSGDSALRSVGLALSSADSLTGLSVSVALDACMAANGLPVSVSAEVSTLAPANSEITPTMTAIGVDITSTGAPVSIVLPPADEVTRNGF